MLVGAVALFLIVRHYGEMLSAPVVARTERLDSWKECRAGRPVAPAAGAGRGRHSRAAARQSVPRRSDSRRSSAKSSPASCSGRRCSGALRRMRPRYLLPRRRRALSRHRRAARRHAVHVPRRAGAEHRSAAWTAADDGRHRRTPASSCRSCSGSALALCLYPRFSTSDVPFTHFALFMGVAMSITAFPVLARILTDRRHDADAARRARADLRRGRTTSPRGACWRSSSAWFRTRRPRGAVLRRLDGGLHRGHVRWSSARVRAAAHGRCRDGRLVATAPSR